ncbi:hypothetical protein [Edaphobacter albus]|uniref:hypothetical protein n=1 Tax=Edaphobacter sp. 4G125 TaxID=2763071 RepID=UPI00164434B6|nr:hypothetical protein [Edaphobacter sp. 4G125]QNI37059.1 hypothetical protein H7846_01600 [Edaphobacter sp. 4G125]
MIRHRTLLLFALLFLVPFALHAQIGVYAGFSGAPVSGAGTNTAYGAQVGIYKQTGYAMNLISVGGDLRGTFLNHDGFHYYTGAVGPRIAFKAPILPLRPYVEGLVGVGNVQYSSNNSSTHFNYQVAGGLDMTIIPRLDWRVVEFDYSALTGQSVNAKILTTGLVLRVW